MLGINGLELIVLALLGVVILGPERLPEYAARLGQLVRTLRRMATGAHEQLREELGPEMDDVDWRKLDPRQYDPRRIIKEALTEELNDIQAETTTSHAPGPAAPVPHRAEAAAPGPGPSAGTTDSLPPVNPPAMPSRPLTAPPEPAAEVIAQKSTTPAEPASTAGPPAQTGPPAGPDLPAERKENA